MKTKLLILLFVLTGCTTSNIRVVDLENKEICKASSIELFMSSSNTHKSACGASQVITDSRSAKISELIHELYKGVE